MTESGREISERVFTAIHRIVARRGEFPIRFRLNRRRWYEMRDHLFSQCNCSGIASSSDIMVFNGVFIVPIDRIAYLRGVKQYRDEIDYDYARLKDRMALTEKGVIIL